MGYYTRYDLKVLPEADSHLIETFRGQNEYAQYSLLANGGTNDSAKWYDHEEELKEFSAKYPETLFILSGEGEESGDIWRKYFKAGKVQVERAEISIGEFDERKLK